MTIRILLVDDHQIFREALHSLLDRIPNLRVVGEVGDGKAALLLARELAPDIVCMDIGMPGINGIETTRELTAAFPEIRVIALSTHADQVYITDMLHAGAAAYVTKAVGGRELLRAIDAVVNNRQYLCPDTTGVLARAMFNQKKGSDSNRLGAREHQVLCLVAKGFSSPQIAAQLDIATGTVDVHRRNIMRKLNVHNSVELTRYAISSGLIPV